MDDVSPKPHRWSPTPYPFPTYILKLFSETEKRAIKIVMPTTGKRSWVVGGQGPVKETMISVHTSTMNS